MTLFYVPFTLNQSLNETIIANIFNLGFANRWTPAICKEYYKAVENIVDEGKVGKNSHQNQWSFPINGTKNRASGQFLLKGQAGRKILAKMDRIIPLSFKFYDNRDEMFNKLIDILK